MKKILVVDDDAAHARMLETVITDWGFLIHLADDGAVAVDMVKKQPFDIVLMDMKMVKMSGMEALQLIKAYNPSLPVIILTARGMEDDRVSGLTAGADDYVVKPFSARELVARVEAVLRRSPERPDVITQLSVGRAMVDLPRREIRVEGEPVKMLSETECEILSHLAANPGRVISREELLTRVWGLSGSRVETRTIDMHVARLRSKLTADCGGETEATITTVRGKGYMLGPSVRATDGTVKDEPPGGSG